MDEIIKPGYVRVSEILGKLQDFQNIPAEVLARKAQIGTDTHTAITALAREDFPAMRAEIQGYVESWSRWDDAARPTYGILEERYYDDELRITGRIDAVVRLGEQRMLVDWKTSASANLKIWELQGHFYMHLLGTSVPVCNKFLFVQLDRSGGLPKVHEFTFQANVWARCKELVRDYRNS